MRLLNISAVRPSVRKGTKMRNTMNIYKRKDGRFEGRIPLGYDNNGKIKYKYLYAKSLAEIKEKMLYAYSNIGNSEQSVCDKTFESYVRNGLRPQSCGSSIPVIAAMKS